MIDQGQKALTQLKADVLADVKQQLEISKNEYAAQNTNKLPVNKNDQNKNDCLGDSTSEASGENTNFI